MWEQVRRGMSRLRLFQDSNIYSHSTAAKAKSGRVRGVSLVPCHVIHANVRRTAMMTMMDPRPNRSCSLSGSKHGYGRHPTAT